MQLRTFLIVCVFLSTSLPSPLLSCFLHCAIPRGLASREQRDANLRGMANATRFLFFVLCHFTWVGVPLITGRQPTWNGQCHFFPVFLGCAIPRGLASRCSRDSNPCGMANAAFVQFLWCGNPQGRLCVPGNQHCANRVYDS